MPPAQHPQPPLPSFKLALRLDHHETILPNLSYPSRPNEHIPWSGSSAPLVFRKTMRRETTIATSTANVQMSCSQFGTRCFPCNRRVGSAQLVSDYSEITID